MRSATRRPLTPTFRLVGSSSEEVPFEPTSVSGLLGWYDLSDISTLYQDSSKTTPVASDGDPIGCIENKANPGTNDATQTTASAKPTYKTSIQGGRSIARFDGGDWLAANAVAATLSGSDKPSTMFAVIKPDAIDGTRSLFRANHSTGDGLIIFDIRTSQYRFARRDDGSTLKSGTGGTPSTTVFSLYAAVCTGIAATGILNGVNALYTGSDVDVGAATVDLAGIGADGSGAGLFDGDMAELIIYDNALSDANREAVEAYLIDKYGLDVPLIIFDGNSMTDGLYSDYPEQVMASLSAGSKNYGVSGQTTANMNSDASSQIDVWYSSARVGVVVCWEGTNHLKLGASAATAYNELVTYCQDRQSAGFKVVILTILPRQDAGLPGSFETDRNTVNSNILSNWATFADALADVAAETELQDPTDPTYFNADKVHLNTTGYGVVADVVLAAIESLL